jgi:hypothetical protein
MKNKRIFLLLTIVIISIVVNSCKKDSQGAIQSLFLGGTWQLASVLAFNYTGNTQTSIDTLDNDTTCHSTQFFTFPTNNTCTYTNFDCITQTPPVASWSLSANQLFLMANVVCKDTTAAGSSMPFSNAAVINLGQFSMVLQTGDIAPNYSLTKKRRIVQYGFIRQKLAGSD